MPAKIDLIETLDASERFGAVTRIQRKAIVSGLTDTSWQVLFSALEEAGIPHAGSRLGDTDLILAERNPTVIDKGVCSVILSYEKHNNGGDDLDNPPYGVLFGEVRSSLQQVTTNLDSENKMIVLSHTFPDGTDTYKDAEGNTLPIDPDYPGQTKRQTGEITYYQPQRTYTLTGLKETDFPWQVENAIAGKLNLTPWREKPARSWLCMSVTWKIYNISSDNKSTYQFTFEFQHNEDGWDPRAVFIDSRSGKPPPGLVEDIGYKTIEKLEAVNYNSVLGSWIVGDYPGGII